MGCLMKISYFLGTLPFTVGAVHGRGHEPNIILLRLKKDSVLYGTEHVKFKIWKMYNFNSRIWTSPCYDINYRLSDRSLVLRYLPNVEDYIDGVYVMRELVR